MKKSFSPEYKAKVALEALKGVKSTGELASAFNVHPTQIGIWKQQLIKRASDLFTDKRTKDGKTPDRTIEELYKVIGKRDVELEWMKKNLQLMDTS